MFERLISLLMMIVEREAYDFSFPEISFHRSAFFHGELVQGYMVTP